MCLQRNQSHQQKGILQDERQLVNLATSVGLKENVPNSSLTLDELSLL